MKLTITHNFADVAKRLTELPEVIREKALVSAVNKSMDQAKTQMIREITSEFQVKAGYVRDRLRINRASAKQGKYRIEASLVGGDGRKRSANIIAFVERSTSMAEARRRGKAGTLSQLFVKIKKGSSKKPLGPAFIANRGRTVFIRLGKGRLPIKAVQTIDVPQMFNQRRINKAVVAALETKFPDIFKREAAFYLSRFNEGSRLA